MNSLHEFCSNSHRGDPTKRRVTAWNKTPFALVSLATAGYLTLASKLIAKPLINSSQNNGLINIILTPPANAISLVVQLRRDFFKNTLAFLKTVNI